MNTPERINPETGDPLDPFVFDETDPVVQRLLKEGIPANRLEEIAAGDAAFADIEE